MATRESPLKKDLLVRKEKVEKLITAIQKSPEISKDRKAALLARNQRTLEELENKIKIFENSPETFSTFYNAAKSDQLNDPTPPQKSKPEPNSIPSYKEIPELSPGKVGIDMPDLSDISDITDSSDLRSPDSSIFASSPPFEGSTPSQKVYFPDGYKNTPSPSSSSPYKGVLKGQSQSEPSVSETFFSPYQRFVQTAFSGTRETPPAVRRRNNPPPRAARSLAEELNEVDIVPGTPPPPPYRQIPATPLSNRPPRRTSEFNLHELRGNVTTTFHHGIEQARTGWQNTSDNTKSNLKTGAAVAGGAALAAAGGILANYLIKKIFGENSNVSSHPEKIDGANVPSSSSKPQTSYPQLDLGGPTAEENIQQVLPPQKGNTYSNATDVQAGNNQANMIGFCTAPPYPLLSAASEKPSPYTNPYGISPAPSQQKESNPHIANANTPGAAAPSLPGPYNSAGGKPTAPATCGGGPAAAAGALAEGGGAAEKASEPDANRTNPITTATGAQQTPANANENVSIQKFANEVQGSLQTLGPAEVFGDARERANMGKGADDPHAYAGPYDAPTFPGGKADTDLTLMGAWKTKNGNTSHLYFGNKNSKGGIRKSAKYLKWSEKNGGNWRKMTKNQAMNVFSKPNRLQGGYFLDQPSAGTMLPDILAATLKRKQDDTSLAMQGAKNMEDSKGVLKAPPRKKQRVL